MNIRSIAPIIFALILPVAACTSATEEEDTTNNANNDANNDEGGEVFTSDLERESPNVDEGDIDAVAEGNTAFALELHEVLRGESGNLFYSPYSMSAALAMTYGGARGTTESQMAQVLHFDLGQAGTHRALNALDLELEARPSQSTDEGDPFELKVTNAIWGQQDYPFEMDFLDLLALNYGAGLHVLDFITDPEGSRQTINAWVEAQTNARIKDLIPEDIITDATRLVLTNAIYFNASWSAPFEPEATTEAPFNTGSGEVMVDTMHQQEHFGHGELDGVQILEMPYTGRQLSMVVLLPEEGQMDALEASLTPERLDELLGALRSQEVFVSFPKFEFELELSLKEPLSDLGMVAPFDSTKADFSGIVDPSVDQLFISAVIHKAFVKVDEEGTEAAAATAVVVDTESGAVDEPVPFNADHPFLFIIRDIPTGTILFVGRVVDPS